MVVPGNDENDCLGLLMFWGRPQKHEMMTRGASSACLRNPIIGGRVQQATILHHAQTRLWHLWSGFITSLRICAELDWTRIVCLETTRRADWKEFVGIGRQCAFPEIWLETLSSFKFSVETFGSLWLVSITHHPQYENFRQHKRFLFFINSNYFLSPQDWRVNGL